MKYNRSALGGNVMDVVNLAILIMIALVLIVALMAWFIGTRQSHVKMSDEIREQIADARIDPGEMEASTVAEQIEEMVRRALAAYPDLADAQLDFATAADETLHIWVRGQEYTAVEAIPDSRIQTAVREAVARFNR
jgi:hypothetical protein